MLACFFGVLALVGAINADTPCQADLVYVVDTSTSICDSVKINQDCQAFDDMKIFLQNFTNSFTVSQTGTNVAMVYFSDVGAPYTTSYFNLNWFSSNAAVDQQIQNFNYWSVQGPHGDTDTGDALAIVRDTVLNVNYGDRPNVPNIVIIFTDGYWTVGADPVTIANQLWARGDTYIYAVVIGPLFTQPNLANIAQLTRSPNNIFSVDSYLALGDYLREELLNVTGCGIGPSDHCLSQPCKNGGTCSNSATTYECTCPPGFLGIDCSEPDPCFVNHCQHGGTCLRNGNSYTCECIPAWIGQSCEQPNPCGDQPCTQLSTQTAPNYGHCLPQGFALNCQTMDDGDYSDPNAPCSSTYYRCAAGQKYSFSCGSDLIYNCQQDYCDYKVNVAACQ